EPVRVEAERVDVDARGDAEVRRFEREGCDAAAENGLVRGGRRDLRVIPSRRRLVHGRRGSLQVELPLGTVEDRSGVGVLVGVEADRDAFVWRERRTIRN